MFTAAMALPITGPPFHGRRLVMSSQIAATSRALRPISRGFHSCSVASITGDSHSMLASPQPSIPWSVSTFRKIQVLNALDTACLLLGSRIACPVSTLNL